jgi:hypothetical protein
MAPWLIKTISDVCPNYDHYQGCCMVTSNLECNEQFCPIKDSKLSLDHVRKMYKLLVKLYDNGKGPLEIGELLDEIKG